MQKLSLSAHHRYLHYPIRAGSPTETRQSVVRPRRMIEPRPPYWAVNHKRRPEIVFRQRLPQRRPRSRVDAPQGPVASHSAGRGRRAGPVARHNAGRGRRAGPVARLSACQARPTRWDSRLPQRRPTATPRRASLSPRGRRAAGTGCPHRAGCCGRRAGLVARNGAGRGRAQG